MSLDKQTVHWGYRLLGSVRKEFDSEESVVILLVPPVRKWRRWSWINRRRWLAKDYENLNRTALSPSSDWRASGSCGEDSPDLVIPHKRSGRTLSDLCMRVPARETNHIQEVVIGHMICGVVEAALCSAKS